MTKSSLSLAFASLLIFAGCAQQATPTGLSNNPKENLVVCQQDAKLCPDGSSVSRVPPDCAFPACITKPTSMITNKIALASLSMQACQAEQSVTQTSCPVVGDIVTKITTTQGDIWLKLFPQFAPKTVENFTGLAERGYYNGLIFHRVIPGFMIQGGDPTGTGTGGESIWGGEFADEFTDQLSNITGALTMANRGPNTNSSQFFINQADNKSLDFGYSIFGQVFSGMETVNAIAQVKRDAADKPLQDVKMEKVEVWKVE